MFYTPLLTFPRFFTNAIDEENIICVVFAISFGVDQFFSRSNTLKINNALKNCVKCLVFVPVKIFRRKMQQLFVFCTILLKDHKENGKLKKNQAYINN